MNEVMIIGAGKIGRGYMAQIFFEAEYQITFIDILPDLIEALNTRGEYQIHEVDTGVDEVFTITNFTALHADQTQEVVDALTRISLVVTSVGAGNLPDVARNISLGIKARVIDSTETPMNILVAENLMNGAEKFKHMIHEHLSPKEIEYMQSHIGIVGTVIGRTVPPPPPSYAGLSIANVVVEPHREFYAYQPDFIGIIPQVGGIKLTNDYEGTVSRKLYVHNCTHAVMGYVGHFYGHQYSHLAMKDVRVSSIVWQAMLETAGAVADTYKFSHDEMHQYVTDLFHRYQNEAMWDTLVRVDRDPIRKLQPDDRLIGAARLIEKTGKEPQALMVGIAAALCYDDPLDEKAMKLQKMIADDGIEMALFHITGIKAQEPLGKGILSSYRNLRGT